MTDPIRAEIRQRLQPVLRVRQIREFTDDAPTEAELDAIVDAARWSGSSHNEQPWRFIVIRDRATLLALLAAGKPSTRSLATASAAVAIVVPGAEDRQLWHAFDEGRAAERMLIAASILGLAGGVSFTWVRPEVRAAMRDILGVPSEWNVRTMVALGHPTEGALRPKSGPGLARLPRHEVVFDERWGG